MRREWEGKILEVRLRNSEDFLKIMESLTRIGVPTPEKVLWQSCHILSKRGRHFIVHFKELFWLDGRESTFSAQDKSRRDSIAELLEDWGLLTVLKPEGFSPSEKHKVKILKFSEKQDWKLRSKYSIGKRHDGREFDAE